MEGGWYSGASFGCPFVPGAAGNLATEDLLYMLSRMKIKTKINLKKLAEASHFMEKILGYSLPSRCLRTIQTKKES